MWVFSYDISWFLSLVMWFTSITDVLRLRQEALHFHWWLSFISFLHITKMILHAAIFAVIISITLLLMCTSFFGFIWCGPFSDAADVLKCAALLWCRRLLRGRLPFRDYRDWFLVMMMSYFSADDADYYADISLMIFEAADVLIIDEAFEDVLFISKISAMPMMKPPFSPCWCFRHFIFFSLFQRRCAADYWWGLREIFRWCRAFGRRATMK